MIIKDRRITIAQLSARLPISTGSVQRIIKEKLGMSKLSTKLVLKNLTPDQKRERLTICTNLLRRYNRNPVKFLRRFITQDETWVHLFDPETTKQCKEWHKKGIEGACESHEGETIC